MLDLSKVAPPAEEIAQAKVMQKFYHRDMLGRFIKNRDVVAWSIGNICILPNSSFLRRL